jgi:hypothetical protein
MNRPLREHFVTPTDIGDTLQTFRYIDALEEYLDYLDKAQLQQGGVVRGAVTSHCISNDIHNCPFTQTCPECTKPATEPLPAEGQAQNGSAECTCKTVTEIWGCQKRCTKNGSLNRA